MTNGHALFCHGYANLNAMERDQCETQCEKEQILANGLADILPICTCIPGSCKSSLCKATAEQGSRGSADLLVCVLVNHVAKYSVSC